MMKLLTVVAAAAMGLTACQNSFEENDVNGVVKGNVVVKFVEEEVRTSVDTSGDSPLFSWDDDETIVVLEQTDALAKALSVNYTKVDGKANIDAEFAVNAGKSAYKYLAIYPESAYVSADNINAATLILPELQVMYSEDSYDPNADLMVSWPVTTTAQPTEAQQLRFTRLAAVAKMTVKGLPEGEVIEKVEFTANGKNLAGTITANLEDPHAFSVKAGVSTVSVTTNSASDVYFTVLPTTLEAGDAYSVVVLTDKHLYVKQSVIPAEMSLVFQAGMVSLVPVNMESVEPSEKWVLVRDASTLEAGDVVTIAAKNNNFVLGCNSTTTFLYASYSTNIVKVGDYLYHPIVTDKSKYSYMIQPLVLSKQDASKAAFDFYNGVDYEGDTKNGYLTNADTNNYLKLSAYPSKNSAFEISIEEGVATIEAKESEFDNVLLKFYHYNPNNTTTQTYRRFVCIDTASIEAAKHDDVCIYKWVGKKEIVPTADAVITVPGTDESVVVPVGGVAEAQEFEGVEFKYVGDWAIEVSSSAEWLKLNYADGVLTYTATANPGGVRYADVTITATHDGKDTQELTFKVVQKGAPTKVTVAEFLAVATEENANKNVEYEVTGILSSKPSSASGTTYLVDTNGNEAKFKHVYMTNDTALSNNTEINKGDVVTIVAAVSDDATGGWSDAHAICKGYYNFSATAEKDLVDYAGGNVKLNLTKTGNLSPIADITCSANADFAEVAYTANAEEATVTLAANDGAPRQVVATFSDGLASTSVTIVQSADTAKGNTWELVTDASTLAVGDQVIVAAKDYDVAMSTTISSEKRSAVAVTKLGNYYLNPTANVQTLVLGKGSAEGTFAFYDAVNEGFLVSSSTSYELNNQTYIDANTSFTISIADGVATIGNKEGSYAENKIYYREPTNNYFYSGETAKQAVCLYRLVGVKGSIPVTPADVTVPATTKKVVVAEEGATEATAINDVVFNYVGDWTITATAADNWISFEFDKATNKLTYTALANEGTVRETTVTITATMEGQEPLTWPFNVLQKGAPMEVSIAEFITKPIDVNVAYKFTGIITVVSTTESGYYTISDGNGNEAQVRYVKTDDGTVVATSKEIGLKKGDVVTVTTVVTTSVGKGGSSANPTIYKGHYRLTATADTSLVAYSGGTATFAISAESSSPEFAPAGGVIKGAMAKAYDFVTFDYTDNATTATATFAANDGAPRNAEFNFKYGLASVSITVGQQNNPSVKVGWYLVTDVNELAVGDKVIIAAKNPDGDKNYAIKKYTSQTASSSSGIAIELLGDSINGVGGVEQFTLESGHADYAGTWSFKGDTYSRYLYPNSSSIKISSTLDNKSSWTIAIAADGKATLTSQIGTGSSSRNTMMLNYTTSNQTFGVYTATTTGKGAIYIYKYYNSLAQ